MGEESLNTFTGRTAVATGAELLGQPATVFPRVAARLAAAAEPNEALISDATNVAAEGKLGVALRPPRELALRGVDRPIAAWPVA